MNSLELILCGILISASAFLAAAEISLFSLSRFQVRALKDQMRGAHRKIKRLLSDPGGLLFTLLILNEMVNIALSSMIAGSVARNSNQDWAFNMVLSILISTPIILFACEITPKVIAAKANRIIAPLVATPMTIIYNFLQPIRKSLSWLIQSLLKLWPSKIASEPSAFLKESDFLIMIEEGHKEGTIQEIELELIKNVFDFDDTQISAIATPFSQVQTLTENTLIRSALDAVKNRRHSRIPITSPDRKKVVGILYAKDLLRAQLDPAQDKQTVSTLMRRPLIVQPSLRLNALFRRFKQQRLHMAVIQTPQGEIQGVVTMSDILDTLLEDVLPDEEAHPGTTK